MAVGNRFRLRFPKLSASLTVEASYVMVMVILALAVLVRAAYVQCGRTTDVMRLHYAVEQLRYREDDQKKALLRGQAERKNAQVEGYIDARTWKKEITVKVYEPEEILRKIAVFERDSTERQED